MTMYLKNPFTTETRLLYMGVWICWVCGQNGTQRGGLEIHHIVGRSSNSPLNSALVCHTCHEHLCHSQTEEQFLFFKTMRFLKAINYILTSKDMYFLEDNKQKLFSVEFMEWMNKI